jgi:hypothetical protein
MLSHLLEMLAGYKVVQTFRKQLGAPAISVLERNCLRAALDLAWMHQKWMKCSPTGTWVSMLISTMEYYTTGEMDKISNMQK